MVKKKYVVAAASAAMVLSAGGGAVAYAAGSSAWDGTDGSGKINACYANVNGQLRVINKAAGGSCLDSEAPLSWPATSVAGGPASGGALGVASNVATVTAPLYAPDSSSAQVAASTSFSVPAGHSFQVQINAQSVITQSGGSCAGNQTTWSGGMLDVYADGDNSHSLIGFTDGFLPGGATGGSQTAVFGPGTHTIVVGDVPSTCSSVSDPGTASMANTFLSVGLLASF